MTSKEQLQWGVLGAAGIAIRQMIPAIQQSQSGRVAAIASRDSEKAAEVAGRFGIDRSYGSYAQLLADSNVEAIYIPLPNSMHCDWSIKAAQAGKHVLCEKPLAVNPRQCWQMIQAADQNNVLLVEAFWYRHHPQHRVVRETLAEGKLGSVRVIRAYLNGNIPDLATNFRASSQLAGGALMDGGCYPVNLCRWLYQRQPKTVSAFLALDPVYKVDLMFNGLLDFGNSQHGVVECGFQHARSYSYQVVGDRGYLVVEPFLNSDHGPTTIRSVIDGQTSEHRFPPTNAFILQAEAFASCLRDGTKPLTTAEDAVQNMTVIEALYQSARHGQHVSLS